MTLADPLAIADFYDLFKVRDVQFVQGFQQQRSATGGGETRYADRAPSLWKAEITTVPMLNAEAEGIMALINSRAGGLKTVLMYNSRLPYPASDLKGEWLSTGSNLPVGGQSLSYDFTAGTYEVDGAVTSEGAVLSCTRSTIGYAQGSDGIWEEFAVDEPRLTDLGLLVEPAFQNIQTYSGTLSNAAWTKNDVDIGSVVDGYTQVREKATSAFHRIFSSTYAIVAGTTYAQTWFVREAGRQFLVARVNRGDATQRQVCFDVVNGTVVYADPMLTASIVKRGDALQLKISFVATSTGAVGTTGLLTAQAAVMNNTIPSFMGDTGKGFDFFAFNFGAGPDAGSPIITTSAAVTRAADACSIMLPPGTHDLTVIRDDGPVSVTGRSVSYSLPNTEHRVIDSVVGTKTALTPGSAASPKLGTITDRLHVAFTDFPAGYEIPLGTYFSIVFDTSRYYLGQFAEAKTADGNGNIGATEIWPPLPASISGTPDVVIVKPPGKFRVVPGSAYPALEGGLYSTVKFSAEQTYGP